MSEYDCDIPKEALDAVKAAKHADMLARLDDILRDLAIIQSRLDVRTIISSVQPNSDVIASVVFDGSGQSTKYAHTSLIKRIFCRIGGISEVSERGKMLDDLDQR